MKILCVSLGCDKNLVDSEVMLKLLEKKGYQLHPALGARGDFLKS